MRGISGRWRSPPAIVAIVAIVSLEAGMARQRKPDKSDIAARLLAVKMMVRGLSHAMPSLAAEMRREACESIDDIITDLAQI